MGTISEMFGLDTSDISVDIMENSDDSFEYSSPSQIPVGHFENIHGQIVYPPYKAKFTFWRDENGLPMASRDKGAIQHEKIAFKATREFIFGVVCGPYGIDLEEAHVLIRVSLGEIELDAQEVYDNFVAPYKITEDDIESDGDIIVRYCLNDNAYRIDDAEFEMFDAGVQWFTRHCDEPDGVEYYRRHSLPAEEVIDSGLNLELLKEFIRINEGEEEESDIPDGGECGDGESADMTEDTEEY